LLIVALRRRGARIDDRSIGIHEPFSDV
jgi:hypothetical protein